MPIPVIDAIVISTPSDIHTDTTVPILVTDPAVPVIPLPSNITVIQQTTATVMHAIVVPKPSAGPVPQLSDIAVPQPSVSANTILSSADSLVAHAPKPADVPSDGPMPMTSKPSAPFCFG